MQRFHAHVYFEPHQFDTATRLRAELGARFPVVTGRLYPSPIGPHTRGMFQVLFERERFAEVVLWLLEHRAGLVVLVHADTGNDLADHTDHALWLGRALPLRLEALEAR